MNDKEIFSHKITKGNRTYFFDINKSEKGDLYLKISESKKTNVGFEHYGLIVFDENLKDFEEAFRKALRKFQELKNPEATEDKTYSVEQIRQTHQQAYSPWTPNDDNKLELLFCEGKPIKELAQIFEGKVGAINSFIVKKPLFPHNP